MKQMKLSFAWRVVVCIVLLLVAYVLQRTLGARLCIFGVYLDALPVIVAATAVLMGSGAGFMCGFAAGLLYDVSGAGIEGLYPLYYLMGGMVCGVIGEYFHNRQIVGTMLCSTGMVLALAVIRYLFLFQFSDMGIFVFVRSMVVQLLLAIVLSPIVMIVVRRICGSRKRIWLAQTMEGGSHGPT